MIINHHQTNQAFTTLTVEPNGMFKVIHLSPTAFKFQVKFDLIDALNLYNRMVEYSLGVRTFIEPATPQRPLAETAPLRSFNHYQNLQLC